jgi:hypothetical protein
VKVVAASISSAALLTAGLALGPGVAGAQNGYDDDGVLWLNDQEVEVVNEGWASANSGFNEVIGNASDNDASTDQSATDDDQLDGSQTTTASNDSDGSADLTTGAATAAGNASETSVSQTNTPGTPVTDDDAIINRQSVYVGNYGMAEANTGGNTAVGNASTNTVYTSQSTASGSTVTATVSNGSTGSATASTGSATASGNVSSTTVTQNN